MSTITTLPHNAGSSNQSLKSARRSNPSLFFLGAIAWMISSVAIVAPAHANTLALASFSGGVSTTAAQRYGGPADTTIGWSFTVGPQDITVTGLGFFDQNGDGLNTAHDVGMWTDSGSPLAFLTIPSGSASTLANGFRFESLGSSLVLQASQSYVIGGHVRFDSADVFFAGTTATFAPEITYGTGRDMAGQPFTEGFGFPYRSRTDISGGFFGPNFQFETQAVPEPSTLTLLLCGIFGFAVYGLRKRLRTA